MTDSLSVLPSTVSELLRAKVSIDRIADFLNRPEVSPPFQTTSGQVVCHNATIAWPCDSSSVDATSRPFQLRDLNLEFPVGRLTLVIGALGTGKSLLVSHRVVDQIECSLTSASRSPWRGRGSLRQYRGPPDFA